MDEIDLERDRRQGFFLQDIQFYEQSTGEEYPPMAAPEFIRAVNALSRGYRLTEKVPGLVKGQELVGEGIRKGIDGATDAVKSVNEKVGGWWDRKIVVLEAAAAKIDAKIDAINRANAAKLMEHRKLNN